ncbi:hypothetical protein [Klebsiella michiganensis]|uniref:hypothetical protein n=1 Tax=Klebsiella michiganensis TaxID=1134687 RepID=UPI001BCE32DD|nr:hypothetical protein [Klebsiella michiganensis]
MSIKSSVERARRKRTFSKNAGMTENRVTVRTEDDQRELDALIEKQLARFVKHELSGADEMQAFSPQVREALEHVLLLKGSPDYITPHGAFSTFITTLLESGLTSEVAPAVAIYTRVYPTSVDYVLKSVPAKASNYLSRYASSQAVMKWADENPGWQEKIINSVKDGSFSVYLRQIREAIGAANLNYRFLKMLEQLCEDAGGLSSNLKQQTREILGRAPETLVLSPREWNKDCNNLRTFILYFMLRDLESRYGEMAHPGRTYITPLYSRQREEHGVMSSQIITFDKSQPIARDFDYGVCIGWRYDSWEQFFYQVSHEAVHLLNPKICPKGMIRTSALDEGMAVRYAEEMLAKYLPYVSRAFVESPVGLDNPYHDAWEAASKLPHDLLAKIRSAFGSFGTIDDPVRFTEMTAPWLTTAEATLLSSDFRYS